MAMTVRCLTGGTGFLLDFFVSAAVVAGQVLIREVTTSALGEVLNPTTTAAADCIGIAQDAATSVGSLTVDPRYDLGGKLLNVAAGGLENLVRIEVDPFMIYRFPIAGGATSGTALAPASATPANILSNDTADVAAPYGLITDTAVGTIDMTHGLVKGRTGNNAGQIRKLTAHSNSTSCTTAMSFVSTLAVGDTFIRVPYSRAVQAVQLTSNFVEANGIIATSTGAAFTVIGVLIDEARDQAYVDCISRDHNLNPESA
jgi:hypothetical protein